MSKPCKEYISQTGHFLEVCYDKITSCNVGSVDEELHNLLD